MGVEIVLHKDDLLRRGEMLVGDFLQHVGVVDGGALFGDLDMPPAFKWGEDHEQVGRSVALVFVVVAGRTAWRDGHGGARLDDQLLRGLVEADNRPFRVVWTGVDLQHILHRSDELGVGLRWDHPLPVQVRLKDVFFSVRPIVLSLARSTILSSTTFSSSRRNDHFA